MRTFGLLCLLQPVPGTLHLKPDRACFMRPTALHDA
jgi:hypothetical protein